MPRHPTDVPMNDEDVTLEIVKTAIYGCGYCIERHENCHDGSLFEPRTTMSGHPSCMSFDYDMVVR